ncbi:MAG: acyl carrier protein [Desulfotalea sp.]
MEKFTEVEEKLLTNILEICQIDVDEAAGMTPTSPLIGPDSLLGLDSLDAVEIVSMIQYDFGVRIISKETSIEVLNSLRSIANYIEQNK